MDLLEAGRIVKPCGLKGRVKVLSYLESSDILKSLDEIYIKQGEKSQPVRLRGVHTKGKIFFLDIEGVTNFESAQALVDCTVMVPAESLKILSDDEYYWRDLIGMEVVTEEGAFLGKIETIFPTGSNDVYVCTGGEREILLPAIADVVKTIDLEQKRIVVQLIDGL